MASGVSTTAHTNGVADATATATAPAAPSAKRPALTKDRTSPEDQSSTRVAHTLTACTRCRQASQNTTPSPSFVTCHDSTETDLSHRGRHDAILVYLDAAPAKEPMPSANTGIPPNDATSTATMSSGYSTEYANWRMRWTR